MFPRVRRVRLLLAIALKLNAVFVPSLLFFFFESYDYCLSYKILHAARAIA